MLITQGMLVIKILSCGRHIAHNSQNTHIIDNFIHNSVYYTYSFVRFLSIRSYVLEHIKMEIYFN